MRVASITEAKAQLSRLVEAALAGEEVVITRAGKPVVRLTLCEHDPTPRDLTRGYWAGRVSVAEDFDAPLPGELLDAFEGRAS